MKWTDLKYVLLFFVANHCRNQLFQLNKSPFDSSPKQRAYLDSRDESVSFSFTDDEAMVESECIELMATETLQDPGELRAKFVIALSILDSAESGAA
jgi:hypothetical protein